MTRTHPNPAHGTPEDETSQPAGHTSALDISPELEEQLEQVLNRAQRFGAELRDTVLRQRPSEGDRLIESAVASTQRLLGKWKLEILYSLTLSQSARFSELRRRLGAISSRTLSNKLKELEEDGHLHRAVTTTRPLRVDYTLTAEGLRIAALTIPLIAYVNHNQKRPPADAERTATDTAPRDPGEQPVAGAHDATP